MLITRLARPLRIPISSRNFNITASRFENKPAATESPKGSSSVDATELLGGHKYTVNGFDRWMLVWVKRYPSKEEVPASVTHECILQARSRARIKTCHYLMGIAIAGFLWAIFTGKKELALGNTIQKERMEWHERMRAEGEAERKAAAAKAAES